MKATIVLVVLFTMFSVIWLGAHNPRIENQQSTENAAVKYLRADASLRQSYALPPDAAEKLQKAVESPLDAEDERLVAAADEALVELRHGAAIERCDWVMSAETARSEVQHIEERLES
jgi:type II secretory pathway component PulJ